MLNFDDPNYLGSRVCPYTNAVIFLFDTGVMKGDSHYRLRYVLEHKGEVIFEGDDYGCPRSTAIDSDESFAGILNFLSCRPGDTDDEYFSDYTPAQLEWVDRYGEELGLFAAELEQGDDSESVYERYISQ